MNLKEIRESKHLTKKQLSELTKISYVEICNLEKFKVIQPRAKTIKALCDALNVSFDELMEENK
jgi:transcriptional regulator with XRE-family HTH domain